MKRTGHRQRFAFSAVFMLPLLLSAFTTGCGAIAQTSAPMRATAATATPTFQVAQTVIATSTDDHADSTSQPQQPTVLPQQTAASIAPVPEPQPMTRHTRELQASVKLIGPPIPETSPAQIIFYNGAKTQKLVALSFDDGPDNRFTPQILDILKQNDVKATFFLVGVHAAQYPAVVHRIADEGHVIANHSWDHAQLSKLNRTQVHDEISRTDDELYKLVGFHPAIFRPPYGETTPVIVQEVKAMDDRLVDWSVDTLDWAGTPEPQIMKYVKSEISPGGIILQHSAGGKNNDLNNTLKALQDIIKTLKAQGYQFVTIPQLLGIPAERP